MPKSDFKDRLAFATIDILGKSYWLDFDDIDILLYSLQKTCLDCPANVEMQSLRKLFEDIVHDYS